VISFFRSFNLARAIILFSLLGSGYLAWVDWKEYEEVKSLRTVFGRQVGTVSGQIQEQAKLHSKLTRDVSGAGFIGTDNPESYIRTIYDGLNMGAVDLLTTPRRKRGYIDHTTKITPRGEGKDKVAFDHYTIANFLYSLEAESRQIKVTQIALNLQDTRLGSGEIPEDLWTFTASVTNRVKDEVRTAGPNAARQ